MKTRRRGSILELGPDTPKWAVANILKHRSELARHIAAARAFIRETTPADAKLPAVGPDPLALESAEQALLVDWAVRECALASDLASGDLAGAAKRLKRIERTVDDLFVFVLGGRADKTVQGALAKVRQAIDKAVEERRKPRETVEPATDLPAPKKKKQRGRVPTNDAAKDARLYRDWQTSQMTEKAFARARGKSYNAVRRALQRARSKARQRQQS